jgi:hypothetical protein
MKKRAKHIIMMTLFDKLHFLGNELVNIEMDLENSELKKYKKENLIIRKEISKEIQNLEYAKDELLKQ